MQWKLYGLWKSEVNSGGAHSISFSAEYHSMQIDDAGEMDFSSNPTRSKTWGEHSLRFFLNFLFVMGEI